MVYVKSKHGEPLMPCTEAKAKKLLKENKALIKTNKPFTIQLLFECENKTQPITLGIDSGYLNIGFSAVTEKKELISGEVKLLQGIKERLLEKAMYRKIRRQRLRYGKARWNNRIKSKPKSWLAPSIQHKLDSHIRFINKIKNILPITKTIIEVANFDIQAIKNPEIKGEEYQQGEQMGFWNLREYILHRDNHKCQNPNCKNKTTSPILEIHHIKYKSNAGTDTPSNLITLCNKCHTSPNHKKGKFLADWQINEPKIRGFKDATFMSIVRWRLVNLIDCSHTYGYVTKNNRIKLKLEKTHYNDAFCIAKGYNQKREKFIIFEQIKRNDRSLEMFYDAKYIDIRTGEKVGGGDLNNGRRTRNKNLNTENLHQYRGQKLSKGQRRIRKQRYSIKTGDLVKYENKIYVSAGTLSHGKYVRLKRPEKEKIELLKNNEKISDENLKYIRVKTELVSPYVFRKGISPIF